MKKFHLKLAKAIICLLLTVYSAVLAAQSFGYITLFGWFGIFGLETLDWYVGVKASFAALLGLLYTVVSIMEAKMCYDGLEWLVD